MDTVLGVGQFYTIVAQKMAMRYGCASVTVEHKNLFMAIDLDVAALKVVAVLN